MKPGEKVPVDTVVVDKTGTLTLGHPALTDFIVEGIPENDALALVAGVEQLSEHPIGLAIVEGAKARGVTPSTVGAFEAINGLGVQAEIGGKRVLVGSHGFLTQRDVDTQHWEERAEAWRAQAKTVVFFAVDCIAAGIAAVADPIKQGTPEAITALKQTDVRIVCSPVILAAPRKPWRSNSVSVRCWPKCYPKTRPVT